MQRKERNDRTLEEVLQSVSDVLFPAALGEIKVDVTSRDVDGDTALHVLSRRGDYVGAKIVIEAGADVNAVGDMGETALHVALSMRNEQIVELLIDAGAHPDITSEFGETARDKAKKLGGKFAELISKRN